ncbi:NACHT domain-containing NTPase, partial [Nostoc sp. 2RC]|uniref:NACHT domain-containing protein n=1 Tax=Nostoc sp. 2RC TaxID=2485484 RepID=UPI0016232B69
FISMYPKNSFVISSKGLDFLTNSLCDGRLEIFELENFDRERAEKFIGKYLEKARGQEPSKDDINNILNRYSAVGTKDYNPLLLSCLCSYCPDENKSEPEKNSKNSTELMQESIYNFVTEWDEVRSPDNSDPYFLLLPEQRIKLLGFLAIRFMQGVNHNGNQANVPASKDTVLDWIIEFINQVDINKTLEERYLKLDINYSIESISSQKKIANYLLNSIEFQDGLIVERYKGEGEIWFIHGGIQKYLAAEYLSYLGLTELDKFLSLKGDWVEVVQQALRLMASQERFNKQHKN